MLRSSYQSNCQNNLISMITQNTLQDLCIQISQNPYKYNISHSDIAQINNYCNKCLPFLRDNLIIQLFSNYPREDITWRRIFVEADRYNIVKIYLFVTEEDLLSLMKNLAFINPNLPFLMEVINTNIQMSKQERLESPKIYKLYDDLFISNAKGRAELRVKLKYLNEANYLDVSRNLYQSLTLASILKGDGIRNRPCVKQVDSIITADRFKALTFNVDVSNQMNVAWG